MTSVDAFRTQFQAAMATLRAGSPGRTSTSSASRESWACTSSSADNWWARFIWGIAGICQSLLANPGSTQQADVDRRARVGPAELGLQPGRSPKSAHATPRCLWDGGAAFNTPFAASDVSGDYFHPSVSGQAKLSAVSWADGYTWTAAPPPNQPPSASFSASCSGLTCEFTNTSTDADGTMTHAWTLRRRRHLHRDEPVAHVHGRRAVHGEPHCHR